MARRWRRRAFVGASFAAVVPNSPMPRLTVEAEARRESFTYKTVGDCEI